MHFKATDEDGDSLELDSSVLYEDRLFCEMRANDAVYLSRQDAERLRDALTDWLNSDGLDQLEPGDMIYSESEDTWGEVRRCCDIVVAKVPQVYYELRTNQPYNIAHLRQLGYRKAKPGATGPAFGHRNGAKVNIKPEDLK